MRQPDAPSASAMHSNRAFVWGCLGLTAAALALRLVRLGAQSLWVDEALSYAWIQEIRKNGHASLLLNIHGPLHALALDLVRHAGTSEWWLRLPSALAGAAAVPALALLGRDLWNRRVGIFAATLLAVSPFSLYYSQECRNYAFSILFAILSLAAARSFVERPSFWRGVALLMAELAAIASNLNALFFLFGLGLWVLWKKRRERAARGGFIAVHVLLGALLLPYAWQVHRQVRPERLVGIEADIGQDAPLRGTTTLHPLSVPYTAFAFAAGYSLGPTLADLRRDPGAAAEPRYWPVLGLVVLGFGVSFVFGLRGAPGWLVAPALSTLAFTVWLAAANMKPFNVRYLSVLLPVFLLIVASGGSRLPRRWAFAVAIAMFVVSIGSCFNYLFVARYARDDVRGAVRYVARHADASDVVLQISLTGLMRYYYDDLGARPVHPPASAFASAEAARDYAAGVRTRAGAVWYLESRPEAIDPAGRLLAALGGQASGVAEVKFTGVTVHRFEYRSQP